MRNLALALQETLEHEIPLTQHLDLRVVNYDEKGLTLRAPLAPEHQSRTHGFRGQFELSGDPCWLGPALAGAARTGDPRQGGYSGQFMRLSSPSKERFLRLLS
jgi:hypothetical protein